MNKVIISCLCLCVSFSVVHYAFARKQLPPQVVVLQYHHVDEKTPPITSVSPDVFRQHMQHLSENHSVISLKQALDAIESQQSLPMNAIAITFDDGYLSIFENAHPILQEFNFPYTVFINPDSIGQLNNHLSWEQVKQMQGLADFANHTIGHPHLLERKNDENEKAWLARVMENIMQAEEMLESELGYSLKWMAYPYGEFNLKLEKALRNAGFIGFGQQSGVVSKINNRDPLPRFPAAGRYANLETLKTKMASIAMPVISRSPADSLTENGAKLESLSFELAPNSEDVNTAQLACYFKNQRIIPEMEANTVTVKLEHIFSAGRIRVNCTAPSINYSPRYYWYSVPFFTPRPEGTFLE